ncbi:MAG: ABC transporter substrate-binding protein [Chloroflexota bacterium]
MTARAPTLAAVMLVAMLLASCGGPSGTAVPKADPKAASKAEYGSRTVTDCTKTTSTFTSAPTRLAAITPSMLEILLAMGQKDRIVGIAAVAPNAFPPDLQKQADALPKLSGEYVPGAFVPTQREQLLAVNPDFVLGGWPSNFDATRGAMSQADMTERKINSYFALSVRCAQTSPMTDFSILYQDIRNLGKVLAAEDAAESMVSKMEATVADAKAKVGDASRPKVFNYNFEDGARGKNAYGIGNQSIINAAIHQAGGKNIFDDVNAVSQAVSWENVADRNPDVIVLEVFAKPTQADFDKAVADAKAFFTNDPGLQNVAAVKNGKFVIMPAEGYYVGSSRNAESVALLARALHPDKLK